MEPPARDWSTWLGRRTFLKRTAMGVGGVALGSLLDPRLLAAPARPGDGGGAVSPLHHPAKAKRVIWMTMAGGPSHLETFDYKPVLARMDGEPMPESMTRGQQ